MDVTRETNTANEDQVRVVLTDGPAGTAELDATLLDIARKAASSNRSARGEEPGTDTPR